MDQVHDRTYIELTTTIVSAFLGNHSMRSDELPGLIQSIYASLTRIGEPVPVKEPEPELKPAVPIRKSVTDEFIISLEDGRRFKSMKRHLALRGMTPDEYRTKWGLPRDYPMTAPGYAAKRSELAKASGLGASRRKSALAVTAEPAAAAEAAPKVRGRPKKKPVAA